MDITEKLHAACTGYTTVRGVPTNDMLLMEAASEIDRLRGAMLTGASILERDGDEWGVGAALRRAMVPNA